MLNRNKKSLALNMKDPRGKEIFNRLAAKADIITENFRPGVVKKLGIDYAAVTQFNPGVIYASMSGFGQTGPYGAKGGFDIIAQGMSGIMMMTGEPGGRPAKVGIAMNDIASGVTALYGILGAYIGKLRTGKGQYLETSLLEAGLAWTQWEFGRSARRRGRSRVPSCRRRRREVWPWGEPPRGKPRTIPAIRAPSGRIPRLLRGTSDRARSTARPSGVGSTDAPPPACASGGRARCAQPGTASSADGGVHRCQEACSYTRSRSSNGCG